jgi:hypothetical protein
MNINVTHFGVLMRYASELGKAKQSGDIERIKIAQRKHDEYHDLCIKADSMIIGTNLDINGYKNENRKSTN